MTGHVFPAFCKVSNLNYTKVRRKRPIGVLRPAERRENDDKEGIPALSSDHSGLKGPNLQKRLILGNKVLYNMADGRQVRMKFMEAKQWLLDG
jgi:hypothetical protein